MDFDAAVKKMQDLGACICDPADIPSSGEWKEKRMADDMTVFASDFKGDIKEYLDTMKSTDVATP